MADATNVSAWSALNTVQRFTVGSVAQRPGYPIGSAYAMHFTTDTPWGIQFWDGNAWNNTGVGLDPTGNATVTAYDATIPIDPTMITIGTVAQRDALGRSPSVRALHFGTNTPWTLFYWDGKTWQNVSKSNTPTADAVIQQYEVFQGFQRCTVGVVANRPVYWPGAQHAAHFATGTPYALSLYDGSAWQDISKYGIP